MCEAQARATLDRAKKGITFTPSPRPTIHDKLSKPASAPRFADLLVSPFPPSLQLPNNRLEILRETARNGSGIFSTHIV